MVMRCALQHFQSAHVPVLVSIKNFTAHIRFVSDYRATIFMNDICDRVCNTARLYATYMLMLLYYRTDLYILIHKIFEKIETDRLNLVLRKSCQYPSVALHKFVMKASTYTNSMTKLLNNTVFIFNPQCLTFLLSKNSCTLSSNLVRCDK